MNAADHEAQIEALQRKIAASERAGDGYKARVKALKDRIAELQKNG